MKLLSLLLLFIFCSLFSFAQEFTLPDSTAILENKVKSVKIYYTGTGNKHLFTQEYQYNNAGQKIYSRSATASYYLSYSYLDNGKIASSIQRNNDGSIIRGYLYEYRETGERYHTSIITGKDSIHPELIFTYDKLGNAIEENYFSRDKLTRSFKNDFDANKKVIHYIDSTPGKGVFEFINGKTIRQTYYNEKNEIIENWTITYDENGIIKSTTNTTGNKAQTYLVKFDLDFQPVVTRDGNKISKEEFVKWDSKFNYLYPRQPGEEFGLPYSDPNAHPVYVHTLKRDKAGNITEDGITRGESWIKEEPVKYEYEYEYW